jgi:hypothetical protein
VTPCSDEAVNSSHLAIALLYLAAPDEAQLAEMELPPPITKKWAEGLTTIASDPEPEHLAADSHFPTSNEQQHHLWRGAVTDLRGVFVGVGTDQNYLMAGWARPEVLLVMDFDQVVVDLHVTYIALFRTAKNPSEFLSLWSAANKKRVLSLLENDLPDMADRTRVTQSFLSYRAAVETRLKRLLKDYGALKIPTFLDDVAQFQYLSAMAKAGQVHAVRGDFRTGAALTDIARRAEEMKKTVRVLYPSNAERDFTYTKPFRSSVRALPFDERSIVLRTVGLGSNKNVDPYYYVVQDGRSFQAWLEEPSLGSIHPLYKRLKPLGKRFLYSIDGKPAD